jgi:oligosaccharide repeat unit polymerase
MDIQSVAVLALGFTGVALLLAILASITGSIPAHAFLYSAVWAPCLCMSQFALEGTIRPGVQTTIILMGAWWAFLIGSILPLLAGRVRFAERPDPIGKIPAAATLCALVVLQWAGALYEILHLDSSGRSLSLSTLVEDMAALRVAGAISENRLPPFLGTFRWAHVVYVPLALMMRSKGYLSRLQLAGIFLLAVASALIHFTRAPIVQLSIVTFVSWLVLYRPRRKVVWLAVASVAAMLVVAFIAAQVAINEQSGTRASLLQSLSAYFGMSPIAYEDILLGQFPREPGYYSLDWLYFFLGKFGVTLAYPNLTRPQIWFPAVTNVYTYLDVFTLDAGITGAILGACTVGAVCSAAYKANCRRSSLLSITVYAYLCYCCLMTPINNEFIRANILTTLIISGMAAWVIRDRGPGIAAAGPGAGAPKALAVS